MKEIMCPSCGRFLRDDGTWQARTLLEASEIITSGSVVKKKCQSCLSGEAVIAAIIGATNHKVNCGH